jgi:hypothetical protein
MQFLSRLIRVFIPAAAFCMLSCLLFGCGQAFSPTAPPTNSFVQAGTMKGIVHGGNQPIFGATVSLYAAGTSGYGSTGVLYAQTASNYDYDGSFSFIQTTGTSPTGPPSTISNTYACPTGSTTNPDPQMYIIASGGETQGAGNGANTAAVFAVAIGKCSTASSVYVDMNEVTSTATMAALQQYFNPSTESFGYPSTTQAVLGFANGVATIANMVNIASGSTLGSTTLAATPLGSTNSITVTVTSEANKINLVANILAACVNNTSNTATPCNTLFIDALPPTAAFTSQPSQTFTSITTSTEDTLQALYFMMTNPDSGGTQAKMSALFSLPSGYTPFQPAYSTAPTDWTIGIYYSSANTCTNSAGNTATSKFLNGVNNPTVDASGNIWSANIGTSGNLFEISPTGTPLTCGLGTLADAAVAVTIDPNGYVWVASNTTVSSKYHLYKWNPTSGALDSTWPAGTASLLAMVADGNNNILYTASTNTSTFDTTSGSLNEFAGAGAVGASPTSITTQQISSLYSNPEWLAVDSNDRAWIAVSHIGTPTSEAVFDVFPSNLTSGTTYKAGTSNGSYTGFETANVATAISGGMGTYSPYGVAIGATTVDTANGAGSGNNKGSYQWQLFTPGAAGSESTAGTATAQDTAQEIGGLASPRGVAVDGAGNVFAASATAATGNYVTGGTVAGMTASADFNISEISSTGVAISSSANSGYGDITGGFQKDLSILPSGPRGVTVDPTGNVWVGLNTSTGTGILELVGLGVPTVTPLSVAAENDKLGQMP